jgi:hypothetical protein
VLSYALFWYSLLPRFYEIRFYTIFLSIFASPHDLSSTFFPQKPYMIFLFSSFSCFSYLLTPKALEYFNYSCKVTLSCKESINSEQKIKFLPHSKHCLHYMLRLVGESDAVCCDSNAWRINSQYICVNYNVRVNRSGVCTYQGHDVVTKAGDTLSSRHVSSRDFTRAVGMWEAI